MNDKEANDELLANVFNQEVIQKRTAERETAYEERIIKKILTRTGLAEQGAILASRAKEATGKGKLTFDWFYQEHDDFPVYIATRKLPWIHQITVPELFNNFTSTVFFSAWEEEKDESPFPKKATALVFDWPGIKGTQLVIHNHTMTYGAANNIAISCMIGKGKNSFFIYLEQFDPFLDSLLLKWNK